MEWDIKEICLRHTPTHAQRTNQCPISILYTGFYNPLQFIKQQTQQRTVKNGNRKRDSIRLCIAHFGGRNTPTALVLQSALNQHSWTGHSDRWPPWADRCAQPQMCSPAASAWQQNSIGAHSKNLCCCIKLFLGALEISNEREWK